MVVLESRNYFKVGDEVQFFGPNMETFNWTINKIYNENLEEIDVSRHPKAIVKIPLNKAVEKDDMMRLKVFDKNDFL